MTTPHGTGTFLLFVYGTLKRGGIRHIVLSRQRFLGVTHTLPGYALVDLGGYPGLIPCPGEPDVVHGELYEVDCSLIGRLDAIEGAPELFRLEPVPVTGQTAPVWAYLYQQDTTGRTRIPSGCWNNPPPGTAP